MQNANLLTVKITAKHIKRGVPYNGYACPLVFALRDLFSPHDRIIVGRWGVRIKDYTYSHSPQSQEFVNNFDCAIPVFPCLVTLTKTVYCGA